MWSKDYLYTLIGDEVNYLNKTLIIIAGMPATGKTTFANYLSDKMQVPLVCKDKLKEIIWDLPGGGV